MKGTEIPAVLFRRSEVSDVLGNVVAVSDGVMIKTVHSYCTNLLFSGGVGISHLFCDFSSFEHVAIKAADTVAPTSRIWMKSWAEMDETLSRG